MTWRLSASTSSESLGLYPEWVVDKDEPESDDAGDGEEMEEGEEGEEGEGGEEDVSALD